MTNSILWNDGHEVIYSSNIISPTYKLWARFSSTNRDNMLLTGLLWRSANTKHLAQCMIHSRHQYYFFPTSTFLYLVLIVGLLGFQWLTLENLILKRILYWACKGSHISKLHHTFFFFNQSNILCDVSTWVMDWGVMRCKLQRSDTNQDHWRSQVWNNYLKSK
jgi:hypothetical protein